MPSGRYGTSNQLAGTAQAIAAAYKTIVALTAATATLRRAWPYEINVGADGTPADNALVFDLSRQTAAGTSTPATPTSLDPADAAADTVGSVNFTAEGTITAASSLWSLAMNQRASYRWVAREGAEFVIPATNLAGVALRCKSAAYTGTVTGQLHHQE